MIEFDENNLSPEYLDAFIGKKVYALHTMDDDINLTIKPYQVMMLTIAKVSVGIDKEESHIACF